MALLESLSSTVQLFKPYFLYTLLAFVVVRLLHNKFRPGLSSIPGPPLAAWTGLWRFFDVQKGTAHLTAIELHKRYGPLVRIGPNHVSVGDPREIANIYGLTKGYTKVRCLRTAPCTDTDSWKTAFYPIQSISWHKKPQMNIFSTRDELYHRDQKRAIATAYSLTSLLAKEDAVDSCSTLFMEKLGAFADEKRPVDLGQWLQYYAFDVIGEFSFAMKLGFLEKGADVDGMMETIAGILVSSTIDAKQHAYHS